MKEQLFSVIDEQNERFLGIWEDVCNIESPWNDKAGVDAVGAYFIRHAEERGWKVEIFEQERVGNVVTITMNSDVDAAPVAFSGHMDTVHAVGSFGSPAVRMDRENDRIYGPGVIDCKGGIVAGFLAMEALWRVGYRARPVVMYLQSDEESGGKLSADATINHICERAQGSVGFFNLEGCYRNAFCTARKGIATFEFTVTGREAHSAACATLGANAILEAAYKIIELEKFKDKDGLTCCCAVIGGGTKHNIVPGECRFVANVRFATTKQLEEFTAFAEGLCREIKVPGCSCSVALPRVRPAMEPNEKNKALADRINEIWRECGMGELNTVFSLGGSDAANVSQSGVPTVDNFGPYGGKIHTPEEFGVISSLAESAKRLALAAYYL